MSSHRLATASTAAAIELESAASLFRSLSRSPSWRRRAACHREVAHLFFPVGTGPLDEQQTEQAKQICGTCPVRPACLASALRTGENFGIFGGLTATERRSLRSSASSD